jgi:hypothetical protein
MSENDDNKRRTKGRERRERERRRLGVKAVRGGVSECRECEGVEEWEGRGERKGEVCGRERKKE